jgi:hypothetical protein
MKRRNCSNTSICAGRNIFFIERDSFARKFGRRGKAAWIIFGKIHASKIFGTKNWAITIRITSLDSEENMKTKLFTSFDFMQTAEFGTD